VFQGYVRGRPQLSTISELPILARSNPTERAPVVYRGSQLAMNLKRCFGNELNDIVLVLERVDLVAYSILCVPVSLL
jgi:hypothetical protein